MADPNANNPRRSEPNHNAPSPSAPRFQAACPSQPQNQSSGARQLAAPKSWIPTPRTVLRPIWIRQEGDAAREIMVSVITLRPGARFQAQLGEHVRSLDNARRGFPTRNPLGINSAPSPTPLGLAQRVGEP
ncbi:hypothetical protein F4774DRAFT_409170 [Daldinia eschscholtzii]|nr:hypothetical protein F4774DRAFT_409170 [Daldinia eschscholtzii]